MATGWLCPEEKHPMKGANVRWISKRDPKAKNGIKRMPFCRACEEESSGRVPEVNA